MYRVNTVRCFANLNRSAYGGGALCAGGVLMIKTTSSQSRCLMEGASPSQSQHTMNRSKRRRRPPTFGAKIPNITTRRMVTKSSGNDTTAPDLDDREDCPMCKKFSKGPCGDRFKQWLSCTDQHPGKDANGEPLHLSTCSDFAEKLAKCLDENADFYSKEDEEEEDAYNKADSKQNSEMQEDAWKEFIHEIEEGIKSGKYNVAPVPKHDINPKIQTRLASGLAATFFSPEKDGKTIIAAYILDENGNVKAAGSKGDMDMGELGSILQFKISDMTSVTCRAIYDTEDGNGDNISIYSRTVQIRG